MSLLGELIAARPSSSCRPCRAGHSPHDARLGLTAGALTPGAEQAVALAGALGGFAEAAAKVLPRPAGLRRAESTVTRAAERGGARVGRRRAAGEAFGPAKDWDWQPGAEGKARADGAADLTGVGMQGPGGRAADGRRAAVAMIYTSGVPGQARYLAGLSGVLAARGQPLRRQGGQVGLDRAERRVAVSEGGAGGAPATAGLLREPAAPHGLPGVPAARLADRLGAGGERL